MIKSKKLSSLVAASLILAGGSFLGVQTVSATDDTSLKHWLFKTVVSSIN